MGAENVFLNAKIARARVCARNTKPTFDTSLGDGEAISNIRIGLRRKGVPFLNVNKILLICLSER